MVEVLTMARVLVVDDNRDGADMLSLLLQTWGYETATAYSGMSALEVADTFEPDVVLLDLAMPGMSGVEVARRLRSQPGNRLVHLVALSGYGRTKDKIEASQAGFDCYLLKPVDDETLRAVLERYDPKTAVQEALSMMYRAQIP